MVGPDKPFICGCNDSINSSLEGRAISSKLCRAIKHYQVTQGDRLLWRSIFILVELTFLPTQRGLEISGVLSIINAHLCMTQLHI